MMGHTGRKRNKIIKEGIRDLVTERRGISTREIYTHVSKIPYRGQLSISRVAAICRSDPKITVIGTFVYEGNEYSLWGIIDENN